MRWPTAPLGTVAKWGSGGTPDRSEARYFGPGIPWVSITDLADGPVGGARESLTPLGVKNSSAKIVPPGTILIAMYGASIGKLGVARIELCTSQAIAFATPDPDIVDARYLFAFIRSIKPLLVARGRGGAQPNIGQADLKAWPIPLPPIDEQRRIAAILDRADALRAKRREALAHFDNLTQSIFLDMFDERRSEWETCELGKVATFYGGSSLPTGDPFNGQRGGYFLVKVSDMNSPGNEVLLETSHAWRSTTGSRAATCPAGSILLPKRGAAIGTNKKRMTTRPSILDPNLMGVAPGPRLDPHYLFEWFHIFDLSTITSGSSVPQLNKQDLAPLVIEIPPLSLQREFAKRKRQLDVATRHQREQARDLTLLLSTLQRRAFAGQL
jgi:type I restriction enzyme S subunit